MLAELESSVIECSDISALKEFYAKTRIPFTHGLVRRLTSNPLFSDHLSDLLIAPAARTFGLEDRLEDTAISDIVWVVGIMKKYRQWL
jgi:hypothetical protein